MHIFYGFLTLLLLLFIALVLCAFFLICSGGRPAFLEKILSKILRMLWPNYHG